MKHCIRVRHYFCCCCCSMPVIEVTCRAPDACDCMFVLWERVCSPRVLCRDPPKPLSQVSSLSSWFQDTGLVACINKWHFPTVHLLGWISYFKSDFIALSLSSLPLLPSWNLTKWNQPTFLFALLPWICWPITTQVLEWCFHKIQIENQYEINDLCQTTRTIRFGY